MLVFVNDNLTNPYNWFTIKGMQDFFSVVGSFGFPVAVASYLLFRFEGKLEELEKTNEILCDEIKDLKNKVIALNKIVKDFKKGTL